jgi:predicted AAA+ superfamily ATPase
MIGIKGARGVGKTTLLLQYIKENLVTDKSTIYISLDDIWFSSNKLVDFADKFYKNGGKYLFIDEVHKYKNWSQELKNIYDDIPDIKIVFTGSSIIELLKSKADLSRRAAMYDMNGLSFREFINFSENVQFASYSLEDIITNHLKISMDICKKIKPLALFNDYLNYGYYPYFIENKLAYHSKLAETINLILETDIPQYLELETDTIEKLKKLMYVIATSVPFKPNVSKIAEKIGITRNTTKLLLQYMKRAKIVNLLYAETKKFNNLQKPEKIFLHHPNLMFCLSEENANKGNTRETFIYNQLESVCPVSYTEKGDFLVNNKYTIEVGGPSKNRSQIYDLGDAFLAIDDIEYGNENRIPLWLFGFLY